MELISQVLGPFMRPSLLRPAVVLAAAYQSRIGKMEQVASAAEGAAQHQFGPLCVHQIIPSVANSRIDSFPRRHADERQHPDLRLFGHISLLLFVGQGFNDQDQLQFEFR
jgi:hypothetical protein